MLDSLIAKGFQVEFLSHARAILSVDFPEALAELEDALLATTIPIEEIIAGGGGEAKGTQRLRRALAAKGWVKTTFIVEKRINGIPRESQSHEVDHVRSFEGGAKIALEIEWNKGGRLSIVDGFSGEFWYWCCIVNEITFLLFSWNKFGMRPWYARAVARAVVQLLPFVLALLLGHSSQTSPILSGLF